MNLREVFRENQLLDSLVCGIRGDDERLVESSIAQLLKDDHQGKIGGILEDSFRHGITESMQKTIARALGKGNDQFLQVFGGFLLETKSDDPFGEFAKQMELDLETPPYEVLSNDRSGQPYGEKDNIKAFWSSMSLSQKVAAKFDIAAKTGRT